MIFSVVSADNFSGITYVHEFYTYDEAYEDMQKQLETVANVTDKNEIVTMTHSENHAHIQFSNGNYYYWNIKTTE